MATNPPNVEIHPSARVAAGVEIGPFSVVGPGCVIGRGCRLHNGVTLAHNTTLGEDNEVFPGAVVGALPQDRKYAGEESRVVIGDRNQIREGVTVHGGTRLGGGLTQIGNDNLLMAQCHVAHDCIVEDEVIIANGVLLGGHVKIETGASLGGLAAVHHFVSIGTQAFVGGLSRVTQDVPPYLLVQGGPARVRSVNTVGLKRVGVPAETLQALKRACRTIYREDLLRSEALEDVLAEGRDVPEIARLVEFLRRAGEGRQGRARERLRD